MGVDPVRVPLMSGRRRPGRPGARSTVSAPIIGPAGVRYGPDSGATEHSERVVDRDLRVGQALPEG